MKEKFLKCINFIKQFFNSNKSLCKKIIAALIIVIAILVIASSLKGDKMGNTIGNSDSYGIAVQDGNWIYYIEIDDSEPVGICRVKNSGKKIEKVADGNFFQLNIIDNYIYCVEEDDDQYNLVRMKKNGKDKEILARDIEDDYYITVTEKWIYYPKNSNLYRVRTNGTERTKISDKNISYYQVDGNWIYYIYATDSSEYIAKMKTNGEETEKIAKIEEDNESFEKLLVKGGKIYYIVSERDKDYNYEYSLYKMNKKGTKQEKICKLDNNIYSISMQEDCIYYTTTPDYSDYSIKSIKYNGTEKTTIQKDDEEIEVINVVEDWIIYGTYNGDYEEILKMVSKDGDKEKEL